MTDEYDDLAKDEEVLGGESHLHRVLARAEKAILAAHEAHEAAGGTPPGSQLEMFTGTPLSPRGTRQVFGRMLGERGLWTLTAPSTDEAFEVTDTTGRLEIVPSSSGVNGVPEITLLIVLVSLWAAGDRQRTGVQVSLRTLAEELGRPWGGRTSSLLVSSLERLRFTGYRLVLGTETGERTTRFTLLRQFSDEWEGAHTDPNRRISIEFDPAVLEMLQDRANLRRIDTSLVQALGEQRDLAKRLLVFLETQSGWRSGVVERLTRTVDHRLAGALGFPAGTKLSKVKDSIVRAGQAIVDLPASRYSLVAVEPLATPGKRGEPTHKMVVVRRRRALGASNTSKT